MTLLNNIHFVIVRHDDEVSRTVNGDLEHPPKLIAIWYDEKYAGPKSQVIEDWDMAKAMAPEAFKEAVGKLHRARQQDGDHYKVACSLADKIAPDQHYWKVARTITEWLRDNDLAA